MPVNTHPSRRIFISYANKLFGRTGGEIAHRLRAEFRSAGFQTWMDIEENRPGSRPYRGDFKIIEDALAWCDTMVVVLADGAYFCEACEKEANWAARAGKPILLVNTDESRPLPIYLSGRSWRRYPDELNSLLADLALDPPQVFRGSDRPNYDTVPLLPPNFVSRVRALSALRSSVVDSGSGRVIVVSGSAGIGKSALVSALCRDESVQSKFPDGTGWISIGREWNGQPFTLKADIASALGRDISAGYGRISNEYPRACDAGYQTVMREMAALVVIDDIWNLEHVKPLLIEAPHCCFLCTTRDWSIAEALSDLTIQVDALDAGEARELLALCSGKEQTALPSEAETVLHVCGGLPGSLTQIGAALRDVGPGDWRKTTQFLEAGQPSAITTIKMAVDSLPAEIRKRYWKLAVLVEDMTAPPVVLRMLWTVDEAEARRTARLLVDRGLASLVQPSGGIRLHDLQLDYARSCYTDQKALNLIHWALRASAEPIALRPEEFGSQIVGRLLPHKDVPSIGELIGDICVGIPRPWLRPVWPSLRAPAAEVVRTLQFASPGVFLTEDGLRAISPCDIQTFRVWDLESGAELYRIEGHRGSPCGHVVAADHHRVFSAFQDGTIKVWDLKTKQELRTLKGHLGLVTGVVMTLGGRAGSISRDRTLKIWDLDTGRELWTTGLHAKYPRDVIITADGGQAVSASFDGRVQVWDLESGRELPVPSEVNHGRLLGLAETSDGRVGISATTLGDLKIWDFATGRVIRTLKGHSHRVSGIATTSDKRYAISASADGMLKVWDLHSGVNVRTLNANSGQALRVSVTADGRRTAATYVDNAVRVWDLAGRQQSLDVQAHSNFVSAVAVTADGRRVVSASWDQTAKVWDLESGQELAVFAGHTQLVTDVAVAAGGRVVSVSTDGTARVWDADRGKELLTFTGHSDQVLAVAVSKGGSRAVTSSRDGTLKVWNVQTGEEMRTIGGLQTWSHSVALTPDDRFVLAVCEPSVLKFCDLQSGRELFTLRGHMGAVTKVAITPDGRHALSSSTDGTIKVWNLARRQLVQTLVVHFDDIRALAVSPDGRLMASGSRQNGIKVWDLANGVVTAGFTCEGGPLSCVFSAPDEIVAGDTSGRVYRLKLVSRESRDLL